MTFLLGFYKTILSNIKPIIIGGLIAAISFFVIQYFANQKISELERNLSTITQNNATLKSNNEILLKANEVNAKTFDMIQENNKQLMSIVGKYNEKNSSNSKKFDNIKQSIGSSNNTSKLSPLLIDTLSKVQGVQNEN